MKYFFCTGLVVLIIFTLQSVHAQNKKFGLGIIIGEPTGISAKLWTSQINAIAFGAGWLVGGYTFDGFDSAHNRATRIHIHVDYLWHSFGAISSSERFPLY